ncbi:MAG: nucleotidyltransferase family protein [Bacteroidales bacterium]
MFEKLNHHIKQYSPELKLLIRFSRNDQDSHEVPHHLSTEKFLNLLQRHKLISIVYSNLAHTETGISATLRENIKQKHSSNTKRNMNFLREIILLSSQLNKQNIPHLFIKGPVLSQMLYNDPLLKSSIDIDILTSFEHVEKMHALLSEAGYRMIYPSFDLNKTERNINYRISHHYNFRHPEKQVNIELHWKLMNPRALLPIDFEELYKRSVEVDINQHKIRTMGKSDYLLYLAVHGSKHRWYSLGWLKDFSELIRQASPEEFTRAFEKAEKFKLLKPFVQGNVLSHLLFKNPLDERIINFYKRKPPERFIIRALQAVKTPIEKIRSHKSGRLMYQFKLRNDLRYWLTLLFRLRTHHSDWEALRLPAWLFFLYYPLRPFLFLYRMYRDR